MFDAGCFRLNQMSDCRVKISRKQPASNYSKNPHLFRALSAPNKPHQRDARAKSGTLCSSGCSRSTGDEVRHVSGISGPTQIGSCDNYYNGRRPLVNLKLNFKMAAGLWPPFCRAGLRRRVLLVLLMPERCGCGFAQRCVVCIVLTRSGSACDERPRTERLSTGEAACMQQRRHESVQGESRREEYGVERV